MLSRTVKVQLIAFVAVAIVAIASLGIGFMDVPGRWLGIGQYDVTVELPESGLLYEGANVTYRGTKVGRVDAVRLTKTGVEAHLSLQTDRPVPSDLDAEVHSQTAIGEQYLALLPRGAGSPPLKDGQVIPRSRTSVPPDIGGLLDAINKGVQAIPKDDLKTVIDESYTAFGGLGPEMSHIVRGGSALAIDARRHLDQLTTLIDGAAPVLDSQSDTSDEVQAWAAHLSNITEQIHGQDGALARVLDNGGPAADEARQLLERVKPTLPILLANLVSVDEVGVAYQPAIEQLLVLIPQGVNILQGFGIANLNTKQDVRGLNMAFNLNMNMPPPCTTGYLPAQQRRPQTFEDAPDRPAGDIYCRIPQDSPYRNVRGARNLPCLTVPGKRAPTVKMCESRENYVPLNEGDNWKGDPNATLSGQDVPQLPPGESHPVPPPSASTPSPAPPPAPAVAAAQYDPATGTYLGPDGNIYTQTDLARGIPKEKSWQSMLLPPSGS